MAPQRPRPSPGPGVAAELVHVWIVLGQDGDGVALLPNDEPGLLLCGAPQVYAIELGNTQSRLSDVVGARDVGSTTFPQKGGKERKEERKQCRKAAPAYLK